MKKLVISVLLIFLGISCLSVKSVFKKSKEQTDMEYSIENKVMEYVYKNKDNYCKYCKEENIFKQSMCIEDFNYIMEQAVFVRIDCEKLIYEFEHGGKDEKINDEGFACYLLHYVLCKHSICEQ